MGAFVAFIAFAVWVVLQPVQPGRQVIGGGVRAMVEGEQWGYLEMIQHFDHAVEGGVLYANYQHEHRGFRLTRANQPDDDSPVWLFRYSTPEAARDGTLSGRYAASRAWGRFLIQSDSPEMLNYYCRHLK